MISGEARTGTDDRLVEDTFTFWAEAIASRSHGFLETVDLNEPASAEAHREYTDLAKSFYPATSEGNTLVGHQLLKDGLVKSNDSMLAPGEFSKLVKALGESTEFGAALELMDNGQNVAFVSDHQWFTNIAVLQAAIYNAADRPGFADNFCLTLSKTLGFLDVVMARAEDGRPSMLVPAIATSTPFTNVTCSIPPTDSLDRPELQPLKEMSYSYNSRATIPLIRWAISGGRGLTTAPSSSLDVANQETKTITMKRTPEIFAEVINRYFPNVLPIATTLNERNEMGFEIGHLTKGETAADVHSAMEWIAQAYQRQLPEGWQVIYKAE